LIPLLDRKISTTMETGPDVNTAVGDTVIIQVASEGPYGVVFEADRNGSAAVIKSWERLPGGKFGVIQKHGGVHVGDVLFAVNETQLDYVPHAEVMFIVNDRNILRKVFKFMSSAEYYRRKSAGAYGSGSAAAAATAAAAAEAKSSFISIIRRARVNQDQGPSKRHVEYEIACQMRAGGRRVEKEIVYKWSVWKRYSEFEQLHKSVKASLGWLMQKIDIPPSHTFVYDKFSAEFIEKRRDELNAYWQQVLAIDKVAEFHKHHCSQELKAFLNVEATVRDAKTSSSSSAAAMDDDLDAAGLGGGRGGGASGRGGPRGPIRRALAGAGGAGRRPQQSLALRRRLPNTLFVKAPSSSGAGGGQAPPQPQQLVSSLPPPPPPPAAAAAAAASLPPPPVAAVAAAPVPTAAPVAAVPPPPAPANVPVASGARLNMLGDIKKMRKYDDE